MPSRIEIHDGVAVLTLDEPRGNALGSSTLGKLHELLNDVELADPHAVVLTGRGKVFGAGLDLLEAHALDPSALASYVDSFEEFFLRLFTFPVPLVAAVNGHALAGGAVVALCCDVRMGADAPLFMALNEVELGMPFPSVALEIARFALPPHRHAEAIALGRRYDVTGALEAGFLHEKATDPVLRAKGRAGEIAKLGKQAVRAVRQELRRDSADRARANAKRTRAAFVEAWLGDDAQQRIRALVDGLKART